MEYIYNVGSTESEEYHYFRLELLLKETAVSQVDNTSTVAYRLRLYAGARYFYGYGLGASLVIDGKTIAVRDRENEPAVDIEKNGYLDIFQGETTLTHNIDGTLTVPVAFSIDMTAGYYTPGPMSGSGDLTLSDIPRVSSLRATSANIGEVSMLAITRHSPDFTHSVKYTFGSQCGYISASGNAVETEEIFSDTSVGFFIPEGFYEEIPNDKRKTCTLELTTYAGTTVIGREEARITVTASPALCAPDVTFTAQDVNPQTFAVTGNANILVRGVSTVKCQVDARGQKGATIQSVLVNGKPDLEFLAVTNKLELVVTDSRGYATRKPLPLEMVDYVLLTCNVSAQRVDPTSGRVRLQVWGQYFDGEFPLGENRLILTCRLPDGREVEIPYTLSENTYQGEVVLTDLSYQSAHTLQITATDALTEIDRIATVNRGVPVFDWGENDFKFNVPVFAPQGVNGICLSKFRTRESQLWITPENAAQTLLVVGNGVLGIISRTDAGFAWTGTEGVICETSDAECVLKFDKETEGFILSDCSWICRD